MTSAARQPLAAGPCTTWVATASRPPGCSAAIRPGSRPSGFWTRPGPTAASTCAVELETGGRTERLPADPDGVFGLTGEEADAYRVEFDVVSAALAAGDPTEFGRADAVDQAAVLEAVGRSAASGLPVEPAPSVA